MVQDQPGLWRELQDSHGDSEKPCLEKQWKSFILSLLALVMYFHQCCWRDRIWGVRLGCGGPYPPDHLAGHRPSVFTLYPATR